MRSARYYNSVGVREMVSAANYDPDIHGTDLCCSDPLCDAPVVFRRCEMSHGGSHSRDPHFASLKRSDHREGCPSIEWDYESDHNSVTLSDAVLKGHPIILNMNFFLGHPLFLEFGRAARTEEINSRYNDFRHRHAHASQSIKSLREFQQFIAKIRQKYPESLANIFVAHCQDLRPLERFTIGDNQEILQSLFGSLVKDPRASIENNGVVIGFPRLIKLHPTQRELQRAQMGGTSVSGNPITLETAGGASLILLNRINFPDTALRQQFMSFAPNEVIATPSLKRGEIEAGHRKFRAGETAFISMNWRVASAQQFTPAPDAKPTFKPEQPPLPGIAAE